MTRGTITHRAKHAGSLRVRTSLERILAMLQEQTDNDQVVVEAVERLMRQGRLRKSAAAAEAAQDLAA
jgi:hypothetical protein